MTSVALSLRDADPSDCARVFDWANDPLVRAQSFSTAPIALDTHERWFAARLADPDTLFFIAELEGEGPVGYARVQRGSEAAVISVALAASARGRGLAAMLIRLATAEAHRRAPCVDLLAYVKPGNPASLQAFVRAGYEPPRQAEHAGEPVWVLCSRPQVSQEL